MKWSLVTDFISIKAHFRIRTTWQISKPIKMISQGQLFSWMVKTVLYCFTPWSLYRHQLVMMCQISNMSCNHHNFHHVASAWQWKHWPMLLKSVLHHLQTPCCASLGTWTKYVTFLVISLSWLVDRLAKKH